MPAAPTTQYRLDVTIHPTEQDLVSTWLFAAGATGVVTQGDLLTAWFTTPNFAATPLPTPAALTAIGEQQFTIEPQVDWHAAWVATIQPVTAGQFLITPTWLADTHPPTPGIIQLIIDPAQAFGSGHHATTAMCLELLQTVATRHRDIPWRVADVGCGTGVLAIGAAKLGATVEAVDTDPVAVAVTTQNAAVNGVSVHTAIGSVERLTSTPHTVVANLLSDTIITFAGALASAATGELIVSGISTERFDDVQTHLAPFIGDAATVLTRDGWVAALFTRNATR